MKHPFQTRRPIAASGQMLILYGVKSVERKPRRGRRSTSPEIGLPRLYPLLFLHPPLPSPPLRFDSIDWRGVRQPARISRAFGTIHTVVYIGIGTLRRRVVFQVSRWRKRVAGRWRRGEGSKGEGESSMEGRRGW